MNVALLRHSFNQIWSRNQLLMVTFYRTLFERYPALEPLFESTEMKAQRKKLFNALALIVQNLEHPEKLTTQLRELGAKHVEYGVDERFYGAFGECLIEALRHTAGPEWDAETEAAWREAFTHVARLMIEGARSGQKTNSE